MSTLRYLQPDVSPPHPRSVWSIVLTLKYIYYIHFKEPELNSWRPSPALPSAPRLPNFHLNRWHQIQSGAG
jgi:hypothetical protein